MEPLARWQRRVGKGGKVFSCPDRRHSEMDSDLARKLGASTLQSWLPFRGWKV